MKMRSWGGVFVRLILEQTVIETDSTIYDL